MGANVKDVISQAARGTPQDRRIAVDIEDATITAGNLEVNLNHTGPQSDSVQLGDGTEIAQIKPDGTVQIGEGSFDTIQNIETATSLASAFNTSSIDTQNYSRAALFASWSGADSGNDATFVIEVSANGTDWSQLGESGMVLLEPADTQIWQMLEFPSRYIRLVYTENANTSGTVDVAFMGRY